MEKSENRKEVSDRNIGITALYSTILIGLLNIGTAIASVVFVPMDESMQNMIHFYQTDTIIVVLPDEYPMTEKEKQAIESFVFWDKGPDYLYKRESDLPETDLDKHLQFFGPLYLFKSKHVQDIPFKASPQGFSYCGRLFQKPEDSFYYMDRTAKRIFTCRNGDAAPFSYVNFQAGGAYQLYVFSGNQLIYSGFDPRERTLGVNDLTALREEYFCHSLESPYFTLNIACGITVDSIPENLVVQLNAYVEELCARLDISLMEIPVTSNYFYVSREDLQHFIAAPLWQTIYGKSHGNVNHITGFDPGIFKHEIGHSIINYTLGENPNPFFMEGFRQYTDYFFSHEAYEKDLKLSVENRALVTATFIDSSDQQFFNSMINYSLSGIVVHYLIDRIGLTRFLQAYAENNISGLILASDGSWECFIAGFNDYLDRQFQIKS